MLLLFWSFYCFIEPQCNLFHTPYPLGVNVYEMRFYVVIFSAFNSNSRYSNSELLCGVVAVIVCVTFSVSEYLIIFFTLDEICILDVGLFQ